MTPFAIAATLLALATAILVARSLRGGPRAGAGTFDDLNAAVYRDQLAELDAALADGSLSGERHAEARANIRARLAAELSRGAAQAKSLAASRTWTFGAAGAVVLAGAALYALLGTPAALTPAARAPEASQEAKHGLQGEQIAAMVERLAARLQANPDDLDGWVMLGRSYSALGRFADAARAYGQATQRQPNDAGLLADQADVLAMAQGRRFDGEPDRLIARALAADPNHVKSLALAGSAAFARRDAA